MFEIELLYPKSLKEMEKGRVSGQKTGFRAKRNGLQQFYFFISIFK